MFEVILNLGCLIFFICFIKDWLDFVLYYLILIIVDFLREFRKVICEKIEFLMFCLKFI